MSAGSEDKHTGAPPVSKPAKKSIPLSHETIVLLYELRERLELTNDDTIRAGLLALKRASDGQGVETKEQKLRRLAGLGDA